MKLPLFLFTAACLVSTPHAAEREMAGPAREENRRSGGFGFSLLPKAFQKNPSVDFNVITEMTAEGKKFPLPTARQPIYYISQPGKFTPMGTEVPANEKPPPIAELERAMQKALAANGYLARPESGPLPRLFVVFNFGSFARFSTAKEDAEAESAAQQAYINASIAATQQGKSPPDPPDSAQLMADTPEELLPYILADLAKRREVLERAALIAGAKFAQELGEAVEQEVQYRQTRAPASVAAGIAVTAADPPPNPLPAETLYLGSGSLATDPASPFNRFRNRNQKLIYFVEEAFSSCYYVIASAYDYAAISKGNRVLLWRTKMTVNSLGISMTESLPALIVNAGPYLGRQMSEPATITRRISREGHVEIGPATVVEDKPASVPSPPPAKNPPPTKP